ncbi:hypothetical protein [Leptothermofonsia sp. ETS-13]|uniref:hypothetical protein n=1 Tax=Leptothermofonsia sp. ETS-13 TaxID=3035696 RepID=UPI003B9E2F10
MTQNPFLQGDIVVKFGEQIIWGPFTVSPGSSIDLPSSSPGVPIPTPSGPFIAPGSLEIAQRLTDQETGIFLDFPFFFDVSQIPALPLGPGPSPRTLTSPDDGTVYTVNYELIPDERLGAAGTVLLALVGGVTIALIVFVTTIVQLVVGFFRSLPYVLGFRPQRLPEVINQSTKRDDMK